MGSEKLEHIKRDCEEALAGSVSMLSALKGEKLFITGGTGFMGSWLAELLCFLNDNHGFGVGITLLSGRAHDFSAKAPHLALRKDVKLIEQDVRNLMEIPDDVAYIIHAAASPDNRINASDPLRTMHVIANGTDAAVAAASRLSNLKKFLNISSGTVYGPQKPDMESMPESYSNGPDCSSALSAYAEAKRFAETLCSAYRSQFKMDIVTARPFAFIGPYQLLDKPWAINNFIRDSLLGGQIRILGDGQTVRSYMYPSDMAFWLLRILADGVSGLAYNVGSPHGITLLELAEKIASHFPTPPRIITGAATGGVIGRSRFVPDVSLAQNTLGLSIKVDLEETLKRTILWHQRQNS